MNDVNLLKFQYITILANSTSHSYHVTHFCFLHSTQESNVICLLLAVHCMHSAGTYELLNCCLGDLSEEEDKTLEKGRY